MKIYVIGRVTNATSGHGCSSDSYELADDGGWDLGKPYPAFKEPKAAATFIKENDIWDAKPIEIELLD